MTRIGFTRQSSVGEGACRRPMFAWTAGGAPLVECGERIGAVRRRAEYRFAKWSQGLGARTFTLSRLAQSRTRRAEAFLCAPRWLAGVHAALPALVCAWHWVEVDCSARHLVPLAGRFCTPATRSGKEYDGSEMKYPILWFIRGYQTTIGRLMPPVCRYEPTCSHYSYAAVQRHGAIRGSWLMIRRLSRCRPGGGSGYDPVPE